MLKLYKYRLYPNTEQRKKLEATLEACRWLYNYCLEERRNAWQQNQQRLTAYDQIKELPKLKKKHQFLASVYSQVLQDVVRRLDKAFQAFFRRLQTGQNPGYPRFKGHGRFKSFTYPQSGFRLVNNRLVLSKIGEIRIKLHRPLEGKVKQLIIKRQADGWYACFVLEVAPQPLPITGRRVGLDRGLKYFVATSDGQLFPAPKFLYKAEQKLKRLHRMVSRRRKGSNRWKKAVAILAKVYLHVANQRLDYAHKLARYLVDNYDLIAVEDLRVQGMVHNQHLAKSILDAAWSLFLELLVYKAAGAGRQVVMVDPRNTSQECSACGRVVPKTLNDRWHYCPHCGLSIDRDINAARNVLQRALALQVA